MAIERYSHVAAHRLNVTGRLRPELTAIDALRFSTFPAGTLSGAPKIRAMEIIDELEPVKRGIYGGAGRFISCPGRAIWTPPSPSVPRCLRTECCVQAGAGIVADSVPETEWEETMSKGRALFRAAALAERGLDEPRAVEKPL
ncbi:MAG: chorismate-binding protein [Candidatus Competibacteraceae bacterium]